VLEDRVQEDDRGAPGPGLRVRIRDLVDVVGADLGQGHSPRRGTMWTRSIESIPRSVAVRASSISRFRRNERPASASVLVRSMR
jgi:hypothetical protein